MNTPPALDLAHRIEAFEEALGRSPDTDLAPFLPEPNHDQYPQILAELVRVDLEHAWTRGRKRQVDDYRRFPGLIENTSVLAAVAFEEYRLRRRAGESISPDTYRAHYHIDTSKWPSLGEPSAAEKSLYQTRVMDVQDRRNNDEDDESECQSVRKWSSASRILPEPGTHFLGFHLVEELGRGAFGRVYLAHQDALARRPVALKVACDIDGESQKLAQLQHTNIVPIYSFHQSGPLQAVCMPFFGRTTLAHVLDRVCGKQGMPSSGRELKSTLNLRLHDTDSRDHSHEQRSVEPIPTAAPPLVDEKGGPIDGWKKLESLSYVEAVLWLGEQLAAGLAHAHERGILHRDLKPANVLLTDDGRPMLVDFNLSEDVKSRDSAERATIGGTLPYMAPEHMEAFSRTGACALDGRCDLFSLGVILYELLTGRYPYPVHLKKRRETILTMLADRCGDPPRMRHLNPAVSPATEAIIRKCLEGNPKKRYQKAEDLREDLNRQLNGLPLRHAVNPSRRERYQKWVRRHPRLTSSGSIAAAAPGLGVLVGAAPPS
jgi:serine/threonine protein kinase